jgi:hypothetical protein
MTASGYERGDFGYERGDFGYEKGVGWLIPRQGDRTA